MKLISESMIKAYKHGYLKVEDLIALQEIKVDYSDRDVKTMGGKIVYLNSQRSYSITVYRKSIKKWYEHGSVFNGIKPITLHHAIDLVIEHEVGHIITHYNGGRGHDNKFKEIVRVCFNHTGWRVL